VCLIIFHIETNEMLLTLCLLYLTAQFCSINFDASSYIDHSTENRNIPVLKHEVTEFKRLGGMRPPLLSSDQSSWLPIQWSGFDCRRYQVL
jgi:hypothetical protein